jgi:hypothetical protein
MAEKSIGGLWVKDSNKGKFFSGVIEIDGKRTSIVVFKNKFKEEEKHPDYKIFLSRPKEQKPKPEVEPEIPEDDSDLPF